MAQYFNYLNLPNHFIHNLYIMYSRSPEIWNDLCEKIEFVFGKWAPIFGIRLYKHILVWNVFFQKEKSAMFETYPTMLKKIENA